MVDSNLIKELDATLLQIGGITKLPPDAASTYVQGLAVAYVADPFSLRWWESLKVPAEYVDYGEADGLSQLAKLVGPRSDAMLVVTDDEEPPWPVYSGDVQSIISMLRSSRFFEYILAAQDLRWVVFDTHMNQLVSAALAG